MKANQSNNLDQQFQNYFEDFKSTPGSHVWTGLEVQLLQKAKRTAQRRRMVLIGGLVCLLAIATYLMFFQTEPDIMNMAKVSVPEAAINPKEAIKHKDLPVNTRPVSIAHEASFIESNAKPYPELVYNSVAESDINSQLVLSQSSSSVESEFENQQIVYWQYDLPTLPVRNSQLYADNVPPTHDLTNGFFEFDRPKGKNKDKWSVSPWLAQARHHRKMKAASPSTGGPFNIDFFEQYEDAHSNLDFGVDIAFKINDRLSIISGLTLQNQMIQVSDYPLVSVYNSQVPLEALFFTSYNANSISFNLTTATGYENGDLVQLTLNAAQNIRMLRIPLMASYQLNKGRWGLSMSAGATWNFVLKSSRLRLTDDNLELRDFMHLASEDVGRSHLGYRVDLALHYRLGQKMSLITGPHVTGSFSSANKNRPIEYIPRSLGWRMGIQRYF